MHMYTSVSEHSDPLKMDMEDDTTVFQTLKSFNSFISQSEAPQRLAEPSPGCGKLQSQYNRSIEVLINLQHRHNRFNCWKATLICSIRTHCLCLFSSSGQRRGIACRIRTSSWTRRRSRWSSVTRELDLSWRRRHLTVQRSWRYGLFWVWI